MNLLELFVRVLFLGVISNQLGAILGFFLKIKSNDGINRITAFTAGITTSIICFEMLCEAFGVGNKYLVIWYTQIGIIFVKILDIIISKINKGNKNRESTLIITAMSAHNIAEGLAIGAAFGISSQLGISLLMAIMIHNIPEGLIIGVSSKREEKKIKSVIIACIVIGIFLGFGAIIGYSMGNISTKYIMPSLAISAGAMLYIVACELIPGMYSAKNNNKIGLIYIIGFLIGCILCFR